MAFAFHVLHIRCSLVVCEAASPLGFCMVCSLNWRAPLLCQAFLLHIYVKALGLSTRCCTLSQLKLAAEPAWRAEEGLCYAAILPPPHFIERPCCSAPPKQSRHWRSHTVVSPWGASLELDRWRACQKGPKNAGMTKSRYALHCGCHKTFMLLLSSFLDHGSPFKWGY